MSDAPHTELVKLAAEHPTL